MMANCQICIRGFLSELELEHHLKYIHRRGPSNQMIYDSVDHCVKKNIQQNPGIMYRPDSNKGSFTHSILKNKVSFTRSILKSNLNQAEILDSNSQNIVIGSTSFDEEFAPDTEVSQDQFHLVDHCGLKGDVTHNTGIKDIDVSQKEMVNDRTVCKGSLRQDIKQNSFLQEDNPQYTEIREDFKPNNASNIGVKKNVHIQKNLGIMYRPDSNKGSFTRSILKNKVSFTRSILKSNLNQADILDSNSQNIIIGSKSFDQKFVPDREVSQNQFKLDKYVKEVPKTSVTKVSMYQTNEILCDNLKESHVIHNNLRIKDGLNKNMKSGDDNYCDIVNRNFKQEDISDADSENLTSDLPINLTSNEVLPDDLLTDDIIPKTPIHNYRISHDSTKKCMKIDYINSCDYLNSSIKEEISDDNSEITPKIMAFPDTNLDENDVLHNDLLSNDFLYKTLKSNEDIHNNLSTNDDIYNNKGLSDPVLKKKLKKKKAKMKDIQSEQNPVKPKKNKEGDTIKKEKKVTREKKFICPFHICYLCPDGPIPGLVLEPPSTTEPTEKTQLIPQTQKMEFCTPESEKQNKNTDSSTSDAFSKTPFSEKLNKNEESPTPEAPLTNFKDLKLHKDIGPENLKIFLQEKGEIHQVMDNKDISSFGQEDNKLSPQSLIDNVESILRATFSDAVYSVFDKRAKPSSVTPLVKNLYKEEASSSTVASLNGFDNDKLSKDIDSTSTQIPNSSPQTSIPHTQSVSVGMEPISSAPDSDGSNKTSDSTSMTSFSANTESAGMGVPLSQSSFDMSNTECDTSKLDKVSTDSEKTIAFWGMKLPVATSELKEPQQPNGSCRIGLEDLNLKDNICKKSDRNLEDKKKDLPSISIKREESPGNSEQPNLDLHSLTLEGEKIHICGICGATFNTKYILSKIKQINRERNRKSKADKITRNETVIKGEKKYTCTLCPRKVATLHALNRHMWRLHENGTKYKCRVCEREFFYPSHLEHHLKIHTGERDFACTLCPKRCASQYHLDRHMIGHTGERKHMCEVCGKSFLHKEHLTRHLHIHTGTGHAYAYRRFNCRICNASVLEAHASRHMQIHQPVKKHPCQTCGKTFGRTDTLRRHQAWHTGRRNHVCGICNKAFLVSQHLKRHMKAHEKKEKIKRGRPRKDPTDPVLKKRPGRPRKTRIPDSDIMFLENASDDTDLHEDEFETLHGELDEYSEDTCARDGDLDFVMQEITKRKPGRPRKQPMASDMANSGQQLTKRRPGRPPKPKRRPGRPPKQQTSIKDMSQQTFKRGPGRPRKVKDPDRDFTNYYEGDTDEEYMGVMTAGEYLKDSEKGELWMKTEYVPKRRPGRPRVRPLPEANIKITEEADGDDPYGGDTDVEDNGADIVKSEKDILSPERKTLATVRRRPGRPRKNPIPIADIESYTGNTYIKDRNLENIDDQYAGDTDVEGGDDIHMVTNEKISKSEEMISKRQPGRPRKRDIADLNSPSSETVRQEKVQRGPGRPRKKSTENTTFEITPDIKLEDADEAPTKYFYIGSAKATEPFVRDTDINNSQYVDRKDISLYRSVLENDCITQRTTDIIKKEKTSEDIYEKVCNKKDMSNLEIGREEISIGNTDLGNTSIKYVVKVE